MPSNLSKLLTLLCFLAAFTSPAHSAFTPARNLDPSNASIRLDSSFQSDAWLVYTYAIDTAGRVVDTTIQSSNGVLEVEQEVLRQVNAMRFSPAQRDGNPVQMPAGPVTFTWILDKPRELSPRFLDIYQKAWAHYAEGDYDTASGLALQLRDYPGRNALEEVKARILAASLANRKQDQAAELRQLGRVVNFQELALNNNFKNLYVPADQYLKILNRILVLQLDRRMLADAGQTLESIQALGPGSDIAREAADSYGRTELALQAVEDVAVDGELVSSYRGGPGNWKLGLSRQHFALGDISGRVDAVFLVCANAEQQLRYPTTKPWSIPAGWGECLVEITGEAGTRVVLHQYASGR